MIFINVCFRLVTRFTPLLGSTSYWLSAHAPSHEVLLPEPARRPSSPTSGRPLRLKDLVPITISRSPETNEPICAVSKNSLRNTEVVALRPSGVVLSERVYEEHCGGEGAPCPVTGMAVKKGDVIKLRRGGTGFASTSVRIGEDGKEENLTVAKKYKPTLT